MLNHIVLAASGGFGDLATNALTLVGKIGALLLVVFVGFKALGHIAKEEFGKAIGLLVIALVPALFLFEPTSAKNLLQNTIQTLTG